VREQLRLLDGLGAAASGDEKKLMSEHFILSSRYEFSFWEQAYRLQSWPV
jgi:thiaminase/transcriptional activator TenA